MCSAKSWAGRHSRIMREQLLSFAMIVCYIHIWSKTLLYSKVEGKKFHKENFGKVIFKNPLLNIFNSYDQNIDIYKVLTSFVYFSMKKGKHFFSSTPRRFKNQTCLKKTIVQFHDQKISVEHIWFPKSSSIIFRVKID